MKTTFAFTVVFLAYLGTCWAQLGTRTIKWKVKSVQDVVTGTQTDHFKELISTPTKVDFISKSGVLSASMTVVGSNGTWLNLDQDGSSTLKIESGAQRGQLIFKRVDGDITISMVIIEGAAKSIFDLRCTGYELLIP